MRGKKVGALAVGVAALLAAGTTWSANEAAQDSVRYTFRPVVVTADKVAGPLRDVDATVSVVPAAVGRALGATTVHEALSRFTPGAFVTQRGTMGFGVGPGAAGGINLRGIGGSPNTQILMLIDGRPDIMGMMGHPLPDAYDLESAERVEIVRGPASVLYGSNAMGGVINIIPRRVRERGQFTQLKLRGGAWNTRLVSAQHGINFGGWDYYLTFASRHTDGHRPESRFDAQNYTFRAAYRPDSRLELTTSGYLAKFKAYDPGPVENPYKDHWVDVLRSGFDIQVQGKTIFGTGKVKAYALYGDHDIYDGWHSIDRTFGVTAHLASKPWKGNTTTLGIDAVRYGGHGINKKFGRDFGRHYITQWAPYVHSRQLLLGRLIASAGLRVEHHELFGYEWVPKFGLVYEVTRNLSLRFNSGKGFRSPTIRELYLFPAPTPTLKPERLWNNEIGMHLQAGRQWLFDLTAFRSEGSNLIRVEGRYPNLKLANSGSFVHRGIEWETTWLPSAGVSLRFFGSLLDPDEQTRYAPKQRLGLTVTFTRGAWDAMAHVDRVSELYGEDYHKERLPDYTVLDLAVGYRFLDPHFRLLVRVQNALNEHYEMMLGYPMPGRALSVELGAVL